MSSYSSQKTSPGALLREAFCLYQNHLVGTAQTVERAVSDLRSLERLLEKYSFRLRHRDILDIGVGQFLPQMHYFSQHNRVVGIDFDVIVQGFNPAQYGKMLVLNGTRRTVKTITRKLLGIDRRYRICLKKQMQVSSLKKQTVLRMDVTKMTFPPESFDFIHSFSVLHSVRNPAVALIGMRRVLRPGGIMYLSFQLYTSESGSLDPRMLKNGLADLALWPHLRQRYTAELKPNAYTNRLRLNQWRDIFESELPGADILLTRSNRPGIEEDARDLVTRGELCDYSLEELLTHRVQILWKKPETTGGW
jgi:SAM-dependent methyltransferase